MSKIRFVLGVVLTAGCPAAETTPGSTEGPETSGTDATSDGTTGSVTSSATSETSAGTTSSGLESSGSSTSGSSSSGTGCHCTSTQIGSEEPTPDGDSFADKVAELADVDVPLAWTGVMGDPTTSVQLDVEAVLAEASYEDGCGRCIGVSGRVRVAIDTDDGFLAERVEAGLTVIPGVSARLDIVATSFEGFMGTLPDAQLDTRYDNAGIEIVWDLSGSERPAHVLVYVPLGGGIAVLGESVDR